MPTICTSWPDGGKKWLKSIRFETICSQIILSKLTFSVYSKMFFFMETEENWQQVKVQYTQTFIHQIIFLKNNVNPQP